MAPRPASQHHRHPPRWPARLRGAAALALVLAAVAGGGCAERHGAVPDGAALEATLASTRASLAALDPAMALRPLSAVTPPGGAGSSPRSPAATARMEGAGSPPQQAAQLIGLPAEAVARLLGTPSLRRREGVAEIWLYSGPACALDLVFYPEDRAAAAGGPLRVGFAAARASGTERRSEAACLHELAGPGTAAPPPPAPAPAPPDAAASGAGA